MNDGAGPTMATARAGAPTRIICPAVADWERHQEVDRRLEQVGASLALLAGFRGVEAERLVDEYRDLCGERAHLELKGHLRELGQVICEYGQPALWKALYRRFAATTTPKGWGIDPHYREGDELRFVYGPVWRTAAAYFAAAARVAPRPARA